MGFGLLDVLDGLVAGFLRRWDIFHHLAAPAFADLLAPYLFGLFCEVRFNLQCQRNLPASTMVVA